MGEIVNKQRLARIHGVSERTLTAWQKEGMPVVEAGSRRGQPNQYDTEETIRWRIAREASKSGGAGEVLILEEERARLTKWQADEKEIQVAVLKRDLIPAGEIAEVWGRFVMATRAAFLPLADRFQQLFGLTDEHRDMADGEIREALSKMGDYDDADDGGQADRRSGRAVSPPA